ncbi:MAG: hypothetical protein H0T62_03320 [Parachlamydiaceae bacterium]|nr:hypothetical protein [Parachlamydiaceae bacterium]
MNLKRFLAATAALFVFIVLFEWLVHGYLLMNLYGETPHVWRTLDEMNTNMPLAMLFRVIFAAWLTYIFTQIYPEGGIVNGVRFGLYFGVFMALLSASWYFYLPISAKLGWQWFAYGVLEGLISGMILGFIYKKDDVKTSS